MKYLSVFLTSLSLLLILCINSCAVFDDMLNPSDVMEKGKNHSAGGDAEAPSISINSLTNGQEVSTNFNISGTVSDNTGIANVTVYYKVTNAASYSSIDAPVSGGIFNVDISVSETNGYTVYAEARDIAGNQGVSSELSFTVSTKVPFVNIQVPIDSGFLLTNNNVVSISGDSGVLLSTIQAVKVVVNGSTNTAALSLGTNWSYNMMLTANITNTVSVFAVAATGMKSQMKTLLIGVDTLPPVVTGLTPTNGEEVSTNFTVTGGVNDNLAGVDSVVLYVRNPGGSVTNSYAVSGSFSQIVTVPADGTYSYWLAYSDNIGNSNQSAPASINVFSSLPVVDILTPIASGLIYTNAMIVSAAGTSSNYGAYTISAVIIIVQNLSGGLSVTNAASGTTVWTYNAILTANASNRIIAFATNNIGKKSQSKQIDIVVDTVNPTELITAPANGSITNASIIGVSVNAGDNFTGTAHQYRNIDAGGWSEFSGLGFSTNLPDGPHTLSVYGVDWALNTSLTNTIVMTNDTLAPAVSITNPVNNLVTNTLVMNIMGTTNNPLNNGFASGIQSFSVTLNGNSQAVNNGWSVTSPSFSNNFTNTIIAVISDLAGNSKAVTNKVVFDTVPPSISNTNITGYIITNVSGNITFRVKASDNFCGIKTQYYRTNNGSWVTFPGNSYTITLGNGFFTNEFYAVDYAGNVSLTDRCFITNDATAPVVTVTSPADGMFTNVKQLFITGTTNDSGFSSGIKQFTVQVISTNTVNAAAYWNGPAYTFDNKSNMIAATIVDNAGNRCSVTNSIYICNTINDWKSYNNLPAYFNPRQGHAVVEFKNSIWMIGGLYNGSTFENDVFYSQNGTNWTSANASAPFTARYGHTAIVFNNNIWVIGGVHSGGYTNDVWYSPDGTNWYRATASAAFCPRGVHSSVVYNNKMWVIGGQKGGYTNDVWYSTDGTNWTCATASANFKSRCAHGSAVYNNKMWVIAGVTTSFITNDVWYSSDGITWTSSGTLPYIISSFGIFTNQYMWILGGAGGLVTNGVLFTQDGLSWQMSSNTNTPGYSPYPFYYQQSALMYKGFIWSICGNTSGAGIWYKEW